ncbi:hypothetical protein ACQKLN_29525 [Paenibacillus glucanolyticus]|uniref:hypothetical protein n=1 Tax=Paenibacillus glucanolyticus TaxID=59843 RepID=UPI003D01FEA3
MKFTEKELNLINIALTHFIQTSAGDSSEYATKQRALGNEIIRKIEWPEKYSSDRLKPETDHNAFMLNGYTQY